MSTPTKARKHKHREDNMKQETVAQVHKSTRSDPVPDAQRTEDPNDNHAPSRDVSVDEESQINSKILSLIETEIKRDANRHSHFTDSRPQSLSFYEDEKVPEELSGNLELLSPEERKHYKKRKDDEMNAYNVIQDLYGGREADEIISSMKKSKSRKKRHDSEMGMGDSREMMIPKEKKKSKKKKRDSSPMSANASNSREKRKHRRKEDGELVPKSDVTVTLEELQDDVFEATNQEEGGGVGPRPEKPKKSPRRADKVYVQKKNKFEAVSKPQQALNRQTAYDFEEDAPGKKFLPYHPLELALSFQGRWMKLCTLCHGLLGGLSLAHLLYLLTNSYHDDDFFKQYSHFSSAFFSCFYVLCVICLISSLDKVDIAHHDSTWRNLCKKPSKHHILPFCYVITLTLHLCAYSLEQKISLAPFLNESISNITQTENISWSVLSIIRSSSAVAGWTIMIFDHPDSFFVHLKGMEKYLPPK